MADCRKWTVLPVRVGIIAPVAWRVPPRHYGGWESIAYLHAEGLVRSGHDITLFASSDSISSARLDSVVPRPLEEDGSLPRRAFETLHLAHALEHAARFDLLHNHAGVYGAVLSRLSPVPVVTTLHGSAAEADSRMLYEHYREQPYISISNAERRLAPDLNYVATVYNGIDTSNLPPVRDPEGYLLYVGRVARDKGVHNCVRVAHATQMPLLIAGIVSRSDQEYFDREIAPHLDTGGIQYIGPVDSAERTVLMSRALACLHLIEYEEAFGLTMAEAMAVGAPVIAFNRGSVPELVRHSVSGFIVRSVDEAVEAVARAGKLSRERCSSWARDAFSAQRMVQGYARVYRSILEKT